MPDFDNISPSELLHTYLEGELDDSQEGVLFQLLVDDAELRSEMREHLAIRTLVQRDASTLLLPSQVKTATMRAIAAVRSEQRAEVVHRRLLPMLWAAVARPFVFSTTMATVGTICALLLWWTGETSVREHAAQQVVRGALAEADPAIVSMEKPHNVVQKAVVLRNNKRKAQEQQPVSQAVEQLPLVVNTSEDEGNETAFPTAESIEPAESQAEGLRAYATLPTISTHSIAVQHSVDMLPPSSHRVQVHLRGLVAQSLLQTDIPSQSNPWFQNMVAGALYHLSEHHALGVEVGQEEFVQHYSGRENNGSVFYEQRPLLFWAGAAYQYTAEPVGVLGGIRPFGRVVVGGMQTGPLARGLVGMLYQPDARVRFSLGIEGTAAAYQFQNKWFSSEKIGVSYGVSLLF